MAELPTAEEMTASTTTEAQFKAALTVLLNNAVSKDLLNQVVANKASIFQTKIDLDSALATAENQSYAQVVADEDEALNSFYQKVDDVWAVSWNPLAQFLQKVADAIIKANKYTDDEVANLGIQSGVFTDENGLRFPFPILLDDEIFAGWKENGDAVFPNFEIKQTDDNSIVLCDETGRTFVKLSEAGIEAEGLAKNQPTNNFKNLDFDNDFTDINYVAVYGQSLSRETVANAITTTQPFQNIMLKSGVWTRYNDTGYDKTEYIPMVEGVGTTGETPVSSICNGIVSRYVSEMPNYPVPVFAGATHGWGNRSIKRLSKSGQGWWTDGFYERMLQQLTDNKTLADSLGKTFSIQGFVYNQGQKDAQEGTSDERATPNQYEYVHLLTRLRKHFSADVKAITGQDFSPIVVLNQICSHLHTGTTVTMQISLIQAQICRTSDNFVMAYPDYILKKQSDNMHLTPESCWLGGQYTARALHQAIYRHQKFQPLEPINVQLSNNKILVTYNNSTQLRISTELCKLAENFGFDIWRSGVVVENMISKVRVVGFNQIEITLNDNLQINDQICYARGRKSTPAVSADALTSRGNVLDSAGFNDVVTSPLGNKFKLHNASLMWQWSQKDGLNSI